MSDELVDIFDEDLNLIGTASKSEAHREGLWHKVFFCWLIRQTPNNEWKIWLQLRGKNKSIGAGLLDASSAGHFKTGENLEQALCREVAEELGLHLPFKQITQFGITKRLNTTDKLKDAEIVHRCYALTTRTLSELSLQRDELDGIFEMDLADAVALFSDTVLQISVQGIIFDKDNTCISNIRQISVADFMDYGKTTYRDFFINLQKTLKENNNG